MFVNTCQMSEKHMLSFTNRRILFLHYLYKRAIFNANNGNSNARKRGSEQLLSFQPRIPNWELDNAVEYPYIVCMVVYFNNLCNSLFYKV